MFTKPESEHQWLDKLSGEWNFESECITGPDQETPEKTVASVTCRSLGGLWSIIETQGRSSERGEWRSIMSVGYDPEQKRYVGTFIASMMTHLWLYSGTIDESGKKLTLDTEGPKFDESGMARYRDSIEIIDDDHWMLSSEILGDDGNWESFMWAHHRRKK